MPELESVFIISFMFRSNFIKVLVYLIPLASLLSFSIQPIVGKYLLPIQGGNVSSWFTIMLFFQASLLIGYIIAFHINKLSLSLQYLLFIIIALISAMTFNLFLRPGSTMSSFEILIFLSSNLLAPMILLFSYSILLQGWLSHTEHKVPYFLYAVSNFGSLLGLIVYPFLIELFLPLSIQTYIYSIVFYIYLGIIILISSILLINMQRKIKRDQVHKDYEPKANRHKIPLYFLWIMLNLIPCIIFLDFTRLLTIEMGSHPLSWIIPLGYYLLSMTFAFSKETRTKSLNIYFLCLIIGTLTLIAKNILIVEPLDNISLIGYGLILLGGINGSLRLLYYYRPYRNPEYFNAFYISLAVGGVLSGLFMNFVFPFVFIRPVEGVIACCLLLIIWIFIYFNDYEEKYYQVSIKPIISSSLILIILMVFASYYYYKENRDFPKRAYYRSIYSTYKIDRKADYILLLSGFTMHGIQLIHEPLTPTAYYWEESPLGLWIRHYQNNHSGYNMGVIGLGVGIASAYNRDSDTITYFEIDPMVLDIAMNETSFLEKSRGISTTIIEDGRIGINKYGPFDFIVVDAFSGAGIPQHLITKEAIKEYMDNSKTNTILMHISSKYWDLPPLIRGICEELNYNYKIINSHSVNTMVFPATTYAVIYKEDISSYLRIIEKNAINTFYYPKSSILWTDDFYSVLSLSKP